MQEEWTTPERWDPSVILRAKEARGKVGNPGTKSKKRQILDVPAAFDIETSHTPGREDAHLYHWQLQIGLDTPTIHGRTWDDLRVMLHRLTETVTDKQTLVIYVHNLSFEWQHLRTVYDFQNDELFCTGDRKILRCYMYGKRIELRCSYLLTNMSLYAWTHKMNVAHPKLDSDHYDHELIRFPWDELSEEELRYSGMTFLAWLRRSWPRWTATVTISKRSRLPVPATSGETPKQLWQDGAVWS